MKKVCCVICGQYRKFKNPKISYIFEKTLVFSIIYSKYENEDKKLFKEEESIEILKILGLIINNYFKNMVIFFLTRNNFVEEVEQNELMSEKYKKVGS